MGESFIAMWFFEKNGAQEAPVEAEEIRLRMNSGELSISTLIWREGMEAWTPLGKVAEFSPSSPALHGASLPSASGPSTPGQPVSGALAMSPMVSMPSSGMALASMILGIVSILMMFSCAIGVVFGIPGAICGHLGRKQIRESAVPMSGAGMAMAGLVMSYLVIALTVVGVIGLVAFYGVMENSATSSGFGFPPSSPLPSSPPTPLPTAP